MMASSDDKITVHLFDRFHLVAAWTASFDSSYMCFSIDENITYVGFCDDFGPMSLGSVFEFCCAIDKMMMKHETMPIAIHTLPKLRSVTNAAFLIGAYMLMKLSFDIDQVMEVLAPVMRMTVAYRDVSPGVQNFHLTVQDCLKGLLRAKHLSWVDFGADGFDLEEYTHFDSLLNADLHEVVPGKFVAMRGPRDIASGELWEDVHRDDGSFGHRNFSPEHYVDILQQFNVQAVVRLNDPQYSKQAFLDGGIAVADLCFEDCTPPPVDVAAKFLAIAEALPGALAVHCKAGLGRTGTLIALYMMKHHGFAAREAMGWLRIVRPGSVIGAQQDFLCAREALMRRSSARLLARECRPAPGGGAAAVQRFIDDAVRVYDARFAAAVAPAPAGPAPVPARFGGDSGALAAHVSAAADRRSAARAAGSPG